MRRFLLKRGIRYIATLWLVLTVAFILFRLVPGDPTVTMLSGSFDPETLDRMRENFGLDRPVHEQYILYLGNFLMGDFGTSFTHHSPVRGILVHRFLNSLVLIVPAILTISVGAFLVGSFSGWRKGNDGEKAISFSIVTLRAIPHFVLGIILLMIFSAQLGWLPTGGMGPITRPDPSFTGTVMDPGFLKYLALPLATLILHYMSEPYLLMRGMIMGDKNAEYVRFHRLKGFDEDEVQRFAARNNMLPLVTYIPVMIVVMVGGLILIEVVFSWPGIGQELVSAVHRRDYPVAQGAFFVIAFAIVTGNLLADLAYSYLDPRVRLGGEPDGQ